MRDNRRGLLAPLIAIIGCDGAGKSTLAADLVSTLSAETETTLCYLGLGSGAIGSKIKGLPLVGPTVERSLARKALQTRTKERRIPGLATALVVYGFSVLRRRRFNQAVALREAGVVVVTDRYPQIEVAGFYDGPGLSAARAGSAAVAALATRERRMYERMADCRPTLVIRLRIDLATAVARKPDHDPALLASKIAATDVLTFQGAAIVDIDACAPYADVRRLAMDAVRTIIG